MGRAIGRFPPAAFATRSRTEQEARDESPTQRDADSSESCALSMRIQRLGRPGGDWRRVIRGAWI